jgi:hypothetical protein
MAILTSAVVACAIVPCRALAIAPVNPIPDTLWRPPAGSVPATGNYIYLDSDAGEWVGAGGKYLYTPANSAITAFASGGYLRVGIHGDEEWCGDFKTMDSIPQLQLGYYPGLRRYPFSDPAIGGLEWSGEGRASNNLTSWFVVDSVTYNASILTSIDLRFEQRPEGGGPALHGAIHWSADDVSQPNGPVNPIPDTLWQPTAGSVPATGNYVYLDSDAGDFIGWGEEYLYTPANATITAFASGRYLRVGVSGGEEWYGEFETMSSIAQLQPGYYPALRHCARNPVTGGLEWKAEGRASNDLTGWFVVDSVTYHDGILTSIDLRFEQHHEGGGPALRGAIHWTDPAAGHISGKVTDPDGSGIADIDVVAYSFSDGAWTYYGGTTTDSLGDYDVGSLATGMYRLEFRDYFGDYLSGFYDGAATIEDATDVAVTADQMAEINVALTPVTHKITPSAGANGFISPNTVQTVNSSDVCTFSIAANPGYHIENVLVDGVSVGPVTNYSFTTVTENHTISATFGASPVTLSTTTRLSGPSRIGVRRPLKLTGTVLSAAHGRVTITMTRKVGKKWKSAGHAHVNAINGRYAYSPKPKYKGYWRFVASYSGGVSGATTFKPSKSGTKSVKVK